jgi:hypothetical protein
MSSLPEREFLALLMTTVAAVGLAQTGDVQRAPAARVGSKLTPSDRSEGAPGAGSKRTKMADAVNETLSRAVSSYLDTARAGNYETALFGLIDLGPAIMPVLQRSYALEVIPGLRSLVVEAAWQMRVPSAVGLLASALDDPCADVWKQALDGLVTLSLPEVRPILEAAATAAAEPERRAWIAEAITQLS